MLVFGGTPGVVGTVVSGPGLPFAVAVGGTGGAPAFETARVMKAVLVGFDLAGEAGLGLAHTLRDRIYAYAFGARAAPAAVSGLAFAGTCDGPQGYTGLDAVYAYYERVRVSTQGAPVRLVFGPQTTLYGFCDKFQFRLEDPSTGLGSFNFMFQTLPRYADGTAPPPAPWDPTPAGEGEEEVPAAPPAQDSFSLFPRTLP